MIASRNLTPQKSLSFLPSSFDPRIEAWRTLVQLWVSLCKADFKNINMACVFIFFSNFWRIPAVQTSFIYCLAKATSRLPVLWVVNCHTIKPTDLGSCALFIRDQLQEVKFLVRMWIKNQCQSIQREKTTCDQLSVRLKILSWKFWSDNN